MAKYVIDLDPGDMHELTTLADEHFDELVEEVESAPEGEEADSATVESRDTFERICNALDNATLLDEPEVQDEP